MVVHHLKVNLMPKNSNIPIKPILQSFDIRKHFLICLRHALDDNFQIIENRHLLLQTLLDFIPEYVSQLIRNHTITLDFVTCYQFHFLNDPALKSDINILDQILKNYFNAIIQTLYIHQENIEFLKTAYNSNNFTAVEQLIITQHETFMKKFIVTHLRCYNCKTTDCAKIVEFKDISTNSSAYQPYCLTCFTAKVKPKINKLNKQSAESIIAINIPTLTDADDFIQDLLVNINLDFPEIRVHYSDLHK